MSPRYVTRARRARVPAGRHHGHEFDRAVAEFFMRRALVEARKGVGRTSPNPPVGAVLVKGGRIIARGYHAQAGLPHAEIVALRAAGARAKGADLYVTLEPCAHFGKTPPCVDAVIAAGVRRVFVGSMDKNPLVAGRGVRKLRRAGIPVLAGVLRAETDEQLRPFFTFIGEKRPYVILKIASTLDGRIASATGDSRWVTGPEARALVHKWRDEVDAVIVGAGTVRADDPRLTTRTARGRDPARVVLSARLDLDPSAAIFRQKSAAPTLVATVRGAPPARARALEAVGAELLYCAPMRGGKVSLADLLRRLAQRGMVSVMVEGGGETFTDFLDLGLADEVRLFIAPKILGGGVPWAKGGGARRVAEALALERVRVERVGDDLLVIGHRRSAREGSPARRARARRQGRAHRRMVGEHAQAEEE